MSKVVELIVEGEPVAKGRHRMNTKTKVSYTPAKTIKAENTIKAEWYRQVGKSYADYTGVVRMDLIFAFPIRKSWTKAKKKEALRRRYHTIKPDRDNLMKTVQDALNGLAYKDDSQVADGSTIKIWDTKGYTKIRIEYLEME